MKVIKSNGFALLDATRTKGEVDGLYVAPIEGESIALRNAIALLVGGGEGARAEASENAARAGFEIIEIIDIPGALLVRELKLRQRGGGAYLVRAGSPHRLAVQAPHTFFDEGTLPIAWALFEQENAGSLFINTVHRNNADKDADVAHNKDSLFQAATAGLLMEAHSPIVVQVHGFVPKGLLLTADAVVSSGDRNTGDPLVARVVASLARVLNDVKRYPEDPGAEAFGATRNVQGRIVRESGGRFVHIELAAKLRAELISNATCRAQVLGALAHGLNESAMPTQPEAAQQPAAPDGAPSLAPLGTPRVSG